uniref:rhomboid protease n=1 Tax=Oreochromis niloticus TaxID=8128 RepID=A0A669BN57_ORENI
MAWRGYAIKWAKTEFVRSQNTTPRSSSLNPYNQQRCGFQREAKRPDIKKKNATQETNTSATEAGTPVPQPPPKVPRPTLFTPLMFTVGFTGCSFGAAAILQYESLKSRLQTAKDEEKSEKGMQGTQDMAYWHDWWNQLSSFQRQLILLVSMVDDFWNSLTEGQKTVTETRCLPMALSSFSHYSIIHMVANMYVLWIFSSGIVSLLGKEQFLAVYLSAGVVSTMVSYTCKAATGRLYPSLGASGAVMAVLAAICSKMPEAKLGIIFLPMVTFTAGTALKVLVAADTAGLLLGWRLFDHAAHLGGALFGVWYVAYGHKLIWRKREPLVKLWHDIRSPGSRGSRPGRGPGGGGGGPTS